MRRDAEIAHAGIGGQDDVDRRREMAGAPALLEEMGDRCRANGLPLEGLCQRRVEEAGADLIEEIEQAGGLSNHRSLAARERLEKRLGMGTCGAQAIAPAEVMGPPLRLDQGGEVSGILDTLAAVVAARMTGDLDDAVDEADVRLGRDQGEWAAQPEVRDRVVVRSKRM